MKRLVSLLVLFASALAAAQTPVYVGVRRAFGSQLDGAIADVKMAAALGFKGIAVDIGVGDDPANVDLEPTRKLAHTAAALGLRINASFSAPPINDRWAALNGGVKWLTKSRYPRSVWKAVAHDVYARKNLLFKVYDYYGRQPEAYVSIEPFSEVGWQGNGGPHIGPQSNHQWEDQYNWISQIGDGYIEQDQFERMADLYTSVNWIGVTVCAPTLENQSGDAQVRELGCWSNPANAKWVSQIVRRCQKVGFNCYAPPGATADTIAKSWASKCLFEVGLIEQSPLGVLRPVIQESNVFAERVAAVPGLDAGQCRLAMLRQMLGMRAVSWGTVFTLVSTNLATANVGLFDSYYQPWPAGTTKIDVRAAAQGDLGTTGGGD